jgi:chromate transporter
VNTKELPALVLVFAYLSLLTVGGGMAAYPELQHLTVMASLAPKSTCTYSLGRCARGRT